MRVKAVVIAGIPGYPGHDPSRMKPVCSTGAGVPGKLPEMFCLVRDPAPPSGYPVILIHNPVPQKQQMTYLEKPWWIDSEDQDRPFPAEFRPTREELETAEAVQFPGEDDFMEYAVDFPLQADDFDTIEDRVLVSTPDPLLDEPEWGAAKSQPEIKKGKASVQTTLDPGPG